MRVLHIFNSLLPSGAETMWAGAKDVLRQSKVETHVLATLTDIGSYSEEMRKAGFKVHHVWHRAQHFLDLGYCWRLFTLLRKERFDAVQVHPEAWRLTNVLVARIAGVKRVVCSVHNVFERNGIRWIQRVLIANLIRLFGGQLVAVGESVCMNERRYLYEPLMIENWIDFGKFTRFSALERSEFLSRMSLPPDSVVVMTVANCNKVKNHAFLFRMARLLPANYYIIHIGAEDPRLGERELVAELGIEARVRFLGVRKDVLDLLAYADVYVMTSLREGFSISCLEALYSGIPSVVSDVPGLRDAADIPLCVIAPLEERMFANEVIEFANLDYLTRMNLKNATRNLMQKRFSMKKNVEKYLEMWGVKV